MKLLRILKIAFLVAMVALVICRFLDWKFNYFTQVTVAVLILAAILFFLDAVFSKKKKR